MDKHNDKCLALWQTLWQTCWAFIIFNISKRFMIWILSLPIFKVGKELWYNILSKLTERRLKCWKLKGFSMCVLSGVNCGVSFPAEYYPNSAEIKMKLFITYFMSMTTITLQGRGEISSGCSIVWTGSTPSQMFWLCSDVRLRVGRLFSPFNIISKYPLSLCNFLTSQEITGRKFSTDSNAAAVRAHTMNPTGVWNGRFVASSRLHKWVPGQPGPPRDLVSNNTQKLKKIINFLRN